MTTTSRAALPWGRVNEADPERVAELLGLEPSRERRKYRCPKHDGTSLHAYPEGRGWYCWGGCGAFSHVDLAAATWGCEPAEACRRLARELGVALPEDGGGLGGRNRPPRIAQERRTGPPATARPRPEPARPRVPQDELLALWNDVSTPVDEDEQTAAYLRGRGLNPERIARWNLARALPTDARPPGWAWYGGPWSRVGYRLLVPMHDSAGELRGIQARAVVDVAEGKSKAVTPAGASNAGLVFADPLGLLLLQGRPLPGWGRLVVVVEGVTDYLARGMFQENPEPAEAWAVLGVIAGSWCPALAARIPDGADVAVRTDPDPAGDRYAAAVMRDLAGRCTLRRLRRGDE
jgi:hypothetical protein